MQTVFTIRWAMTIRILSSVTAAGILAACAGRPESPEAGTQQTAGPTGTSTTTPKPTSTSRPSPTAAITPTDIIVPPILDEGIFTLTTRADEGENERNSFDLDQSINTGGKEADISFSLGCGSQCFDDLYTVNGAMVFGVGDLPAEFETCVLHRRQFEEGGLYAWGAHNFFCILTNEGNMSLVIAVESSYDRGDKLRMRYLTWAMAYPG